MRVEPPARAEPSARMDSPRVERAARVERQAPPPAAPRIERPERGDARGYAAPAAHPTPPARIAAPPRVERSERPPQAAERSRRGGGEGQAGPPSAKRGS